jgi:hypothetical protein
VGTVPDVSKGLAGLTVHPWGQQTSQGTFPESVRLMEERGPMTAISIVAIVEACVVSLSCDVSLLLMTGASTCGATGKPRAGLGEAVRTPVVVQSSNRSYLGAKGPSGNGCAEPQPNTLGIVPAGITAPRGVCLRGRGLSKGEYEGLDA